jgi:predicted amidophosphoribosyltransferase
MKNVDLKTETPTFGNVLLGDSALCSGCNTKQGTVDRNMFDGLCADCTDKALYDDGFAKKAEIRNEELKRHFA